MSKSLAISSIATTLILLASINMTYAEPLYQWTDSHGITTYSPKPPAANSGINYVEISGEISTLRKSQLSRNTTKPTMPSTKKSKIIRQQPRKIINPQLSHQEIPQKKRIKKTAIKKALLRRDCKTKAKQITAMETRLSRETNATQLDKWIIAVSKQQKLYNSVCKK